ncbi:MAG: Tfp pilus assembly protein FimT/FimU [Mariprofundus sp.]
MERLPGNPESGFTLLEIILVIVIMAVTSMMVAPSYFSTVSASLDDEGKRLAQVLRLASEEATLSGNIFRVRFRQHGYQFQFSDREGVWQTLQESPYQTYHLPEGFQIVEIRPSLPLSEDMDKEKTGEEAVLADLLLQPGGVRKIANIILSTEPDDGQLTVQLRPGPGGIAVKKDDATSHP